jgi:hypothetical protein
MMDVEIDRMPWTRDLMTSEEMQQWVASREEAGLKIDIETCELGCWYAYDCDPYGARPDLPEEMKQIGTNRFVRSAESRGWVCEDDLPLASVEAMYERIHREADTYESQATKGPARVMASQTRTVAGRGELCLLHRMAR